MGFKIGKEPLLEVLLFVERVSRYTLSDIEERGMGPDRELYMVYGGFLGNSGDITRYVCPLVKIYQSENNHGRTSSKYLLIQFMVPQSDGVNGPLMWHTLIHL